MRIALHSVSFAAALAVCGCGSSDRISDPAAPANFQGTFAGDFTVSSTLGTLYHGTLQLAQSGRAVIGTLSVVSLRNASVAGTIDGTTASMTFTYSDNCGGTGTVVADLLQNGTLLTGTYTNQDCTSGLTGGFSLTKQ
jgi:hypothetical protein